uniref:DDE Tnp4 domain-containing protein n=1 Tax=Meloidogyne javanica TaxID=6303 RepID=A0A915LTT7_MELJA
MHQMTASKCIERAPNGPDEYSYVNRKNFQSINVQAICDLDCKFLAVDCKWPGSTHDSFVLRNSNVWTYFESSASGNKTLLLGDSGYPLKP